MLKLGLGSLDVALVKPNLGNNPLTAVGTEVLDTDATLPNLQVAYKLSVGPAAIKLFGGYNTYDAVAESTTASREESIDSYVVGIQPTASFGPLTVKLIGWMAKNPKEYGSVADKSAFNATHDAAGIKDVDAMGYGFDLGYKISDMYDVRAGWGAAEYELDHALANENDVSFYYVQLNIQPVKGVKFTPEFAVNDYGDTTTDGVAAEQGKITFYGVYWYIEW